MESASSKVSEDISIGSVRKKNEIFLHDGNMAYKQELEEGEFDFSDDDGFYDEDEDYLARKIDL